MKFIIAGMAALALVITGGLYFTLRTAAPDPENFTTWPKQLKECADKPLGDALWCVADRTDNFDKYKPTLMAEWKKRHG